MIMIVADETANRGFHDREMEMSIQYHVMLIRQSNDQILMRCYIIYPILQISSSKCKQRVCLYYGL